MKHLLPIGIAITLTTAVLAQPTLRVIESHWTEPRTNQVFTIGIADTETNHTYYLIRTTDISLTKDQWAVGSGPFSGTNVEIVQSINVGSNSARRFYALEDITGGDSRQELFSETNFVDIPIEAESGGNYTNNPPVP